MDQTREGSRDIGETLDSKQLRANTGKSKFLVIGPPELSIELLKEAEKDPIMMGKNKLESSKSHKRNIHTNFGNNKQKESRIQIHNRKHGTKGHE